MTQDADLASQDRVCLSWLLVIKQSAISSHSPNLQFRVDPLFPMFRISVPFCYPTAATNPSLSVYPMSAHLDSPWRPHSTCLPANLVYCLICSSTFQLLGMWVESGESSPIEVFIPKYIHALFSQGQCYFN